MENGDVYIRWAIDDNLTAGWIKRGATMDMAGILKALRYSLLIYDDVVMQGTFSLQDKFGNTEEANVVLISMKKGTVDRINWKNFLDENIYDIAEDVYRHPAFR